VVDYSHSNQNEGMAMSVSDDKESIQAIELLEWQRLRIEGHSYRAIGEIIGRSPNTVKGWIRRYGLEKPPSIPPKPVVYKRKKQLSHGRTAPIQANGTRNVYLLRYFSTQQRSCKPIFAKTKQKTYMPPPFNATRAAFSLEGGVPMSELPYFVQCLMALLEQLPSFVDLIVRHAVEILSAM